MQGATAENLATPTFYSAYCRRVNWYDVNEPPFSTSILLRSRYRIRKAWKEEQYDYVLLRFPIIKIRPFEFRLLPNGRLDRGANGVISADIVLPFRAERFVCGDVRIVIPGYEETLTCR